MFRMQRSGAAPAMLPAGEKAAAAAISLLMALLVAAFSASTRLAFAQPPDALDTAECRQARAELEEAGDAAQQRQPGSAAALERAQRQAALICLGRDERPAAGRVIQPGIAVTPVAPMLPVLPAASLRPVEIAPLPPLAIPRPIVITQCDAGGCWDSAGNRLNRLGPNLIGPNGVCNVLGSFASCP